MNEDIARRFRREREKDPMLPARVALSIARPSHGGDGWEEQGRHHAKWAKTVDGFLITLRVETDSVYPRENDGYGHYLGETHGDRDYEWNGNYPRPDEPLPLGLPYTAFRYSGANRQGDGGYFMPDEIEEQYAYYRRCGQSKSVAWDLTRTWVEARLSDYFGTPLAYVDVLITASKEGVALGRSSMSTSILEDDDYVFTMAEEYGLIDDAIEAARDAITRLTTKPTDTREEASA